MIKKFNNISNPIGAETSDAATNQEATYEHKTRDVAFNNFAVAAWFGIEKKVNNIIKNKIHATYSDRREDAYNAAHIKFNNRYVRSIESGVIEFTDGHLFNIALWSILDAISELFDTGLSEAGQIYEKKSFDAIQAGEDFSADLNSDHHAVNVRSKVELVANYASKTDDKRFPYACALLLGGYTQFEIAQKLGVRGPAVSKIFRKHGAFIKELLLGEQCEWEGY